MGGTEGKRQREATNDEDERKGEEMGMRHGNGRKRQGRGGPQEEETGEERREEGAE